MDRRDARHIADMASEMLAHNSTQEPHCSPSPHKRLCAAVLARALVDMQGSAKRTGTRDAIEAAAWFFSPTSDPTFPLEEVLEALGLDRGAVIGKADLLGHILRHLDAITERLLIGDSGGRLLFALLALGQGLASASWLTDPRKDRATRQIFSLLSDSRADARLGDILCRRSYVVVSVFQSPSWSALAETWRQLSQFCTGSPESISPPSVPTRRQTLSSQRKQKDRQGPQELSSEPQKTPPT